MALMFPPSLICQFQMLHPPEKRCLCFDFVLTCHSLFSSKPYAQNSISLADIQLHSNWPYHMISIDYLIHTRISHYCSLKRRLNNIIYMNFIKPTLLDFYLIYKERCSHSLGVYETDQIRQRSKYKVREGKYWKTNKMEKSKKETALAGLESMTLCLNKWKWMECIDKSDNKPIHINSLTSEV